MRVEIVVLGVLALAALSACAGTRPQSRELAPDALVASACAISCPADSAYAETRGSVECRSGATAACQCTDRARPIASCEVLE